ncbi:MAG: hypothetical protein KA340_08110 [Saprospiraceae bacterium]|nr:hypothetical protein [Saprospiraceae bacterium]
MIDFIPLKRVDGSFDEGTNPEVLISLKDIVAAHEHSTNDNFEFTRIYMSNNIIFDCNISFSEFERRIEIIMNKPVGKLNFITVTPDNNRKMTININDIKYLTPGINCTNLGLFSKDKDLMVKEDIDELLKLLY